MNGLIRGVSVGLFALAAQFSDAALASPTVIVTVDVESTESLPLPNQVDAICEGKVPCGLMHIVDMLNERGFAGTFFLNVYEYKAWGESALRNIAQKLQGAGQDVELHTHPQWAYDPARPYMYSYSAGDQNRIIADGVRLLKAWTGLPVVAHRAGAYSANEDTLAALARNGILLDSSFFFRNPNSRLNGLGLPRNLPAQIGPIVEIPITVYERRERPLTLSGIAPPYTTIGKLDVHSIQSEREADLAMDALIGADLPYIVVFLHSFSFIEDPRRGDRAMRADALSMRVFTTLLDRLSRNKLRVATAREVSAHVVSIDMGNRGVVPSVEFNIPTYKYAERMFRSQPAVTRLLVGLLIVAAGCGSLFGVFAFCRARTVRHNAQE